MKAFNNFRYEISDHAAVRMAQRNLKQSDLETVVKYGQKIRKTGAVFYFLGERNLPKKEENKMARLIGTTVIIAGETVVTVYRNKDAVSRIKRKRKNAPSSATSRPLIAEGH